MNLSFSKYWIPVFLALAAGLAIGWIDSRPGWNDTGVTAGLIFISSFIIGLLSNKNAWLLALIIGLCVTSFNYILHNNLESAISFVIAFAGVYSGVFVKYIVRK